MQKITVGLGDYSYPICIGEGILDQLGACLDLVDFPAKVAVVTNPLIGDLYARTVIDSLTASGRTVTVIRIPDGEEYKSSATLGEIYDTLIEQGFDRSCGMLALGGGVIGDITGYAAATFLRGIPFAQVPTTLLAQVDSSVGGKTGINHPLGKNLIGAFYQPRHVHIDVHVLGTLSEREYASGLAEVIKYGIISDAEFFAWLERNADPLKKRDPAALGHAVMISCQTKSNVVENDEKELGLRAILNYGHTFGHAVEKLAGYGVVKHGEAVAIGMVVAAGISHQCGFCSQEDVSRIRELLARFNLPVAPPEFPVAEYLKVMARDKKVREGKLRFVLNHGIGSVDLHLVEDLEAVLSLLLTDRS
jgi:3-dehydroquinate synthase